MMATEGREQTIRLDGACHDLVDEKYGRRCVLRDVHAEITPGVNVAVLGPDPALLTAFLHLIAGSYVPHRGRITSRGLGISPIINAGGAAGATLALAMTAMENIQFYARLHDIKAPALARVVDLAVQLGGQMSKPVRSLDALKRRALETAIFAALPYECYLVDRIDILQPEFRWLIAHSARVREASMIFVTADVRVAKQFGGVGLLVEGGRLKKHPALRAGFRHTQDRVSRSQGSPLNG